MSKDCRISHIQVSKSIIKKLEVIDSYKTRDIDSVPQLLFQSKIFVMANLPHREIKPDTCWFKTNGNYTLHLSAGERIEGDRVVPIGIPYGSYARLLLIWLTTQVVIHKSRVVKVNDSLSAFMRDMGIKPTGGVNGTIRAIKDQLIRICSCKVVIDSQNFEEGLNGIQFYLVEEKHVRWLREKNHSREVISQRGEITISQKFYEHIINKSVPFDYEVVSAIKQSSLSLDLYIWLTYRMYYLKTPIIVSWQQLQDQMGSQYVDIKNFRAKFLRSLAEIKIFYPDLNADAVRGGLFLSPSQLHIQRTA